MEVHLLLEMYGRNTRVSLTQINILMMKIVGLSGIWVVLKDGHFILQI